MISLHISDNKGDRIILVGNSYTDQLSWHWQQIYCAQNAFAINSNYLLYGKVHIMRSELTRQSMHQKRLCFCVNSGKGVMLTFQVLVICITENY